MRKIQEIFDSISDDLLNKIPPLADNDKQAISLIKQILINFLDDIAAQFTHKHKVTSDEYIAVVTELIQPNKAPNIKVKIKMLEQFIPEGEPARFVLTTILAAIENKTNILANKSKSFEEEISSLKIKEINAANPKIRKSADRDLIFFQECQLALKKLEALTYPNRLERIASTIAMFNKIIINAPTYVINYSSGENDQEIKSSLTELQEKYSEALTLTNTPISVDNDLKLRKLVEDCEWLCRKNISAFCIALGFKLQYLIIILPHHKFEPISLQHQKLLTYTNTLIQPEDQLTVFNELLDNFAVLFKDILKQIQTIPNQAATRSYIESERIAALQSKREFPSDQYRYVLSGSDLRSSQNIFVQDQLKINAHDIENPNKYVMSREMANNLSQIAKDGERNLRYEGEEHKEMKGDALRIFLISKFGQVNTANLIRHYDQGVSLMISAAINSPIATAGGSNNNEEKPDPTELISVIPSDDITQNIYLKNKIVFRDAACSEIKLSVPYDNDKNLDQESVWIIKVNLKIVSWITADGFVIENIGCDNAMVANCFTQKNCYDDVKYLVDVILEQQANLAAKKVKLDKTINGKELNKQAIANAQIEITNFKQGKITFDELLKNIDTLANSSYALKHHSFFGKSKKAVASIPTGTYTALDKVRTALNEVKKAFDVNVSRFAQEKPAAPVLALKRA